MPCEASPSLIAPLMTMLPELAVMERSPPVRPKFSAIVCVAVLLLKMLPASFTLLPLRVKAAAELAKVMPPTLNPDDKLFVLLVPSDPPKVSD